MRCYDLTQAGYQFSDILGRHDYNAIGTWWLLNGEGAIVPIILSAQNNRTCVLIN